MGRFAEWMSSGARESLRDYALPVDRSDASASLVADWAADAQIVLLGEASHGTHEFYEMRARITQQLVERHGFRAVAIEGDWPDAYRVNRYVRRMDGARDPNDALGGFLRFPQWMWRNSVVLEFVQWLRERNDRQDNTADKAGFYGLDLYSLNASMHAVIAYLEKVDPDAARQARASYSCFEEFGDNTERYAWASRELGSGLCEDVVVKELIELRARQSEYQRPGAERDENEFFHAEQNARLARNAERYYRSMFHGRVASWNVRDRHMAETLDEVVAFLRRQQQQPKVVVWAHNSHIGDARATELGEHGELNLGQLARERFGARSRLIGFSTYSGTVTAASDWDEPAERKRVRPGLENSYETFFHELGLPGFFLPLQGRGAVPGGCVPERRLERAIGVIYRPETERHSHYFHARIAEQFDAVLHFDETQSVGPLERTPRWEAGEVPETFPSGI